MPPVNFNQVKDAWWQDLVPLVSQLVKFCTTDEGLMVNGTRNDTEFIHGHA